MRKLETFSQKLEAPLQRASVILMMVILVIIFVEVVSRYIFGQSHAFMEEFSKWSMVWFACLMIAVIAQGRRHISIDLLPRRLPERYKPALPIVFDIAILGFAIVLLWSGIEAAILVKAAGLTSATVVSTPLWIPRLCVPIAAMFLAFFSIQHLAMDIVSLGKHRGGKE